MRPHIVWFGENLDPKVLELTGESIIIIIINVCSSRNNIIILFFFCSPVEKAVNECDLCLVVGTSSVVYPAAMFAPQVAYRGVSVAEFNIESTPATGDFE